jgi:ribosome-associated heat shock protein Hsp15
MRLDQWLWAVRIFKTRSLATDAAREGRVTVNGVDAKPSREPRPGEIIGVRFPPIVRSFEHLGDPRSRVGAALVPQYARETTPAADLERWRADQIEAAKLKREQPVRLTKRDRRIWSRMSGKD